MTGASDPTEKRALAERAGLSRSLVSQEEIRAARQAGTKVLDVPAGTIVTPLAHDLAVDCGIQIRIAGASSLGSTPKGDDAGAGPAPLEGGVIAIGADHGGFDLKETLRSWLEGRGLSVRDLGTHTKASCDYPDLAAAVAKAVALGDARWGILIDGAGIGSAMAANKVPGVLAATCHDARTASNSREHNGANVLCLGSTGLDEAGLKAIVDAWLRTPTGGGRHARRVDKIRAIEGSFLRS
ncbi:MAG: ribose 5-phosphate isomerase B [Planctomycetes bacterium]|nr:ribose 5-phosphate isomerase B [Planctomycetota bacterium]